MTIEVPMMARNVRVRTYHDPLRTFDAYAVEFRDPRRWEWLHLASFPSIRDAAKCAESCRLMLEVHGVASSIAD